MDIEFTFLMFVFMISLIGLVTIAGEVRKFAYIIPLLLLLAISEIDTPNITYRESNVRQYKYSQCEAIFNDIKSQLVNADQSGETHIILEVPFYGGIIWPLWTASIDTFNGYFYKMGVINRRIAIDKMIPNEQKNIDLKLFD